MGVKVHSSRRRTSPLRFQRRRNELSVLVTILLVAACAPPVPEAVRPTIEWLYSRGAPCTYFPPNQGSSFAQWSCRSEDPTGAARNIVVNGNDRGVLSVIAQEQAPEGGVLERPSAISFLVDTAASVPPNAGHEGDIVDWIRINPEGGVTTIGNIRVLLAVEDDSATMSFTYPLGP